MIPTDAELETWKEAAEKATAIGTKPFTKYPLTLDEIHLLRISTDIVPALIAAVIELKAENERLRVALIETWTGHENGYCPVCGQLPETSKLLMPDNMKGHKTDCVLAELMCLPRRQP